MELLPTESERTDLLDALANLIAKRGFETFVHAPILEPTAKFFPDPWEPSKRGVRALALRLLRHAALDLDADVGLYDNREHQPLRTGEETAAWFAGIHEGVCRFGADVGQLSESAAIVGTMSHEVAHAYRAFHRLTVRTRQVEEEATDLTTVYLGFGVLTLNNTYRMRTSGRLAGPRVISSTTVSWGGYLPLQAMAFLLAAQVVARDASKTERKRIADCLEANQAACFTAACKALGSADAVRARLAIPPMAVWPAPPPFDLEPLPANALFVPRAVKRKKAKPPPPKRVYRVRTPSIMSFSGGFAVVAVILGNLWTNPTMPNRVGIVLGIVLVAFVGGAWLGARQWSIHCSGCTAANDSLSSVCASCRGEFAADAWRPIDYLAFDEAENEAELRRLAAESEAIRRKGLRRALVWTTAITAVLLLMLWWPR